MPESDHPNFAAFLLSRECWERVGPFDEKFYPAYFEDNDYHYRIQLEGWRAITHPPAMFYHYGSRTQNEACSAPLGPWQRSRRKPAALSESGGGPPGGEQFQKPSAPFEGFWWI